MHLFPPLVYTEGVRWTQGAKGRKSDNMADYIPPPLYVTNASQNVSFPILCNRPYSLTFCPLHSVSSVYNPCKPGMETVTQ